MGGTCRQEGPIGGNKALGRRTDIQILNQSELETI